MQIILLEILAVWELQVSFSLKFIIYRFYLIYLLPILVDVEHTHVRFLGNLVLNLWDCGGQEAFMENYFASQREVCKNHLFFQISYII